MMNIPVLHDNDEEQKKTATELIPNPDILDPDVQAMIRTMASNTMPVSHQHFRSMLVDIHSNGCSRYVEMH